MPITALPTPPARSDAPAAFIARADAFIAALPSFVAELNVFAASLSTFATTATSVTSLTIGAGSKALTVDTGKSFQVGMTVKIASTVAPSNWMLGDVTSYNSSTGALVVMVSGTQGSGTVADWTVSMAASGGASLGSNTYTGAQNEAQGADIASASTIDLSAATGNLVDVTGVATITAITLAQGAERVVCFLDACTLTHSASLVLPGHANIVTAAGDFATFRGYAAGVVRCTEYMLASAVPDVHQATNKATPANADESGWWDSVTQKLVKVTWANLKTTIAAYMSASGNAATATNMPYSGLTGAVPTWNQNTTGNATTATNAGYATNAGTATNAGYATYAGYAMPAYGAVGSYCHAAVNGVPHFAGTTYAASGLYFFSAAGGQQSAGLSGTWLCLGPNAAYAVEYLSLFQRVA